MANAASIPIIDISGSQGDQAGIAEALVDAAAKHGFVYIRNTGQDISLLQVEQAFSIVCANNHESSRRLSPHYCLVLQLITSSNNIFSREPFSILRLKISNDVR